MSPKYTIDESRNWYNNLPAKRSAAAMIVRHGDAVLMVKDDYKEAMTFPGGVIDPEESPLIAAIRETQEETALEIPDDKVHFFTVAYVPPVNGFLDRFQFFFLAQIDDVLKAEVTVASGIEYDEWVSLAEIGEKAGGRPTYRAIQHMLITNEITPYFEAHRKGIAPWQT